MKLMSRFISVHRSLQLALLSILLLSVFQLANHQALFASTTESNNNREIYHLLNRLAFGPTIEDVAHVRQTGIEQYIAEQLTPQSVQENPELAEHLALLDTLRLDPPQLYVQYGPLKAVNGVNPSPQEVEARRQRAKIVLNQAREARLLRALYSRRQLNEVMVDFWFNHFNVYSGKGLARLWVGAYEEQAIRPHALGKFRDLLLATARHPAMLIYLDNVQNVAAGTKRADGKEMGINENYAREVMELHTLGVDGGYTQDDVIVLARILTGWGVVRDENASSDGSGFRFFKNRHDFEPKRFLGHDIRSRGEGEGVEALNILASSPATARYIAKKLVQYFVADDPPPNLVERVAAAFKDTDGNIGATLRSLFASPEFKNSIGKKYKTPYYFVLSAVRATGLSVRNVQPLIEATTKSGMQLYGCATPDGYSNTADKWMSPDGTLQRVTFADDLGAGRLPLTVDRPRARVQADEKKPVIRGREQVDASSLYSLLGPQLSDRTRSVVAGAQSAERAGLMLGSPDFMWR
jgi:uncharacterized protein (DUF1800 family)